MTSSESSHTLTHSTIADSKLDTQPIFSYYKKAPDPKTIPRILPPGQSEITGSLTRQFTDSVNVFGRVKSSGPSQPPMTSKNAKSIAKNKAKNKPVPSPAQLRAEIKAEEDKRREKLELEKKMRKRMKTAADNKKKAKEKAKQKALESRGKQPEGQYSLSKFGFLPGGSTRAPEK